ncbi:hypothetical protein GGF50DRAFT_62485, partial [Schizophyllum commune]
LLERAASAANLELQRNGFVPSLNEARLIHEVSDAISSGMLVIDAEIERLHDLRRQALAQLDIHKSITSPVRRLPPELLSEVFAILHDCEGQTNTDKATSDEAYLVIHVLSRVCSALRRSGFS